LLTDIAFKVPVYERPRGNLVGLSLVAQDGQARGEGALDSHLDAARRLIDALPRNGSPDAAEVRAHVIDWYRTVSAALSSTHNLADLEPHVKRSLARFPDDAGILFDAGSFYETFAAPLTQAVLVGDPERRGLQRSGPRMVEYKPYTRGGLLYEAERYFRRAIERDPSPAEAHVRLGHVLLERGRGGEALEPLERAVALQSDAIGGYYGWMFLGSALARTGKPAEAIRAYRSALALFPHAQSAHLAISQIAAETGDAKLAREALERVLEDRRDDALDPWWLYHRARGRDYESLYLAFSQQVDRLPPVNVETWRIR
jgi:tetratricopeptide (TPR) repeat protein